MNPESHYTENDADRLVDVYLMYDMRFQPGGFLSFSSKLMMARNAFSRLMNVNFTEHFPCPTVLIEDCHSQAMQNFEIYMKQTQLAMLRIQQLTLPNLPHDRLGLSSYWEPKLARDENQNPYSFTEQKFVTQKICCCTQ